MRLALNILAVLAAVALSACGAVEKEPPPPVVGADAGVAVDSDAGWQDPGLTRGDAGAVLYPPPPYGPMPGDTIDNMDLMGHRGGVSDFSGGTWAQPETIALSDYYDPDGTKGPYKLMIVNASARWCVVCKMEAPVLLQKCQGNRSRGLVCVTSIFEDEAYNPAEWVDVEWWANEYGIDYPMLLDEQLKWGPYFDKAATPMNMFIDLKTMKILKIMMGYDPEELDASIAQYLGL